MRASRRLGKNKRRDQRPGYVPTRVDKAIVTTLFLFLLLRFISTIAGEPDARLWGINYAAFLKGKPDILIALLAPFLAFLRPVREWLSERLLPERHGKSSPISSLVVLSTFGGLAMAAALLFPVSFAFLGDGGFYLTELFRVMQGDPAHSSIIKPTSFLTGHLLVMMTDMIRPDDLTIPYKILGMLGLFVVLAGLFLPLRREGKPIMTLFIILVLGSCGSLLFFGYIELYALTYAWIVAYLMTAWASFQRGIHFVVPGICLVLAVAFGMSAVIFVPSYLVLLAFHQPRVLGRERLPLLSAVLFAVMSGLWFVLLFVPGIDPHHAYFIPVSSTEMVMKGIHFGWMRYTMFSPAHLADILNILFLVGGVATVVVPVILLTARKAVDWRSPLHLFSLLAVVGGGMLLLGGQFSFGMARDWDIGVIPAASVLFLAGVLLMELDRTGKASLRFLLPILLLVSLSGLYTWVRVNHSGEASAERLHALLRMDRAVLPPVHTYNGLENLRKYYVKNQKGEGFLAAVKEMIETRYQQMDSYRKLLEMLPNIPDPGRRGLEFDWLLQSLLTEVRTTRKGNDFSYADPRVMREFISRVIISANLEGLGERTRIFIPSFQAAFGDWKELPLVLMSAGTEPPMEEQIRVVEVSVDSATTDPALLQIKGRLYEKAERYAEAAEVYHQLLDHDPETFPMVYTALAALYLDTLGDTARARAVLEDCIARCALSADASKARNTLAALGGR